MLNVVELIASHDDCAFDQPCRFGHRVEGHAVYCHNEAWEDSPRKCRRSWYTDGRIKDEDCPGFEANPQFSGPVSPTALSGSACRKCRGGRRISTEPGKIATCPLCIGSGAEPTAVQ